MMKINKILLLAFVLCGLTIVFAAPQLATAQEVLTKPGVYKNEVLTNPGGNDSSNPKYIERAFQDVFGYPPDAERSAYWEARNADYSTIVAEESKRQNAEPIARKLMIFRVYKDTFGRIANKKEIDYWLPKDKYYKQIFDANRAYLYSPNGVTDLVETVKRALTQKNGKTPSDGEIKQAISSYRKKKAIFGEMR